MLEMTRQRRIGVIQGKEREEILIVLEEDAPSHNRGEPGDASQRLSSESG